MTKILISSCLLGHKVRYNGSSLAVEEKDFKKLVSLNEIILFCPEISAGLPTPRPSVEITNGEGSDVLEGSARALCFNGRDLTREFILGAQNALRLCIKEAVQFAVLTESSPSCGSSLIYDGSFTGVKKTGMGITAALLEMNGIKVFSQYNSSELLKCLGQK